MAPTFYRIILFSLFTVVFIPNGAQAKSIDWFVTNTTSINGRPIPTDGNIFSCSDRIYTMVSVRDLSKSKHTLIVDWIDPNGRQREHTVHDFHYYEKQQWMWAWLTLHPPRGAVALRLFNPSIGMSEFIGIWTVRIIIDHLVIGQAKFELLC